MYFLLTPHSPVPTGRYFQCLYSKLYGDNEKFKTEMYILIRFGFISSVLLTQTLVFTNGCAVKDWRQNQLDLIEYLAVYGINVLK